MLIHKIWQTNKRDADIQLDFKKSHVFDMCFYLEFYKTASNLICFHFDFRLLGLCFHIFVYEHVNSEILK